MHCEIKSLLMVLYFQLYAWGGGSCLGTGSAEATALRPRLVEDLANTRLVDIACGDSHCLALSHGRFNDMLKMTMTLTLYGNKKPPVTTCLFAGSSLQYILAVNNIVLLM